MSQLVQAKWDRKLTNWALWKAGADSKGKIGAPRDWWDAPPRPPQPLVGEALDTDDLIVRMSIGDQDDRDRAEAITAWYVWLGNTRDKAIALGIHPDTLHDRVRSARYRLDDLDLLRRRSTVKPPAQPDSKKRDVPSVTCGING